MTLAQTNAQSLETLLKGTLMALRSFSADPVAMYSLENGVLVTGEVKARTICLFSTESVSLEGNRLVLKGQRSTLVQNNIKRLSGSDGDEQMTLVLDMRDADLTSVLPKISSLLFFPDFDTAVNTLPRQVEVFLPYDISHTRKPGVQWIDDAGQWRSVPTKDSQYLHPIPIAIPAPKFTEEARKANTSGIVEVVFEVTDTGHVKDFWLGNLLKNGLSEAALVAVRGYRFKPARYNGKNIGSEILAEVNFEVRR